MNDCFHKAFKKVRITTKQPKRLNEVGDLLEQRKKLEKNKSDLTKNEEENIEHIEELIADKCEDVNKKKDMDHFQELAGNEGILKHQGIWKIKRKVFPKSKPSIPVGKKNIKNQLVSNAEELRKFIWIPINTDFAKDLFNLVLKNF